MGRHYLNIIAKDPLGRAVGGDNVKVRFYNGRTDVLATAFLALTGATTVALPKRAYPSSLEHTIRVQPLTTDTVIEVDSSTGWEAGDVIRIRGGGQQVERAIKTIIDADTIELDAAIGVAFPVGSVLRGQTGHARIAVEDSQDYSADVENIGESWRSTRVDFKVQATGAPVDATYVTTAAESGLSNEKVLGTDVVMEGTLAARPAASINGRIYVTTDETGGRTAYRDTGAAWNKIAFPAAATHAQLAGIGANDHHAQLHKAAHEPGGGDAMAVDAVAGTGSLRTLGAGAQQAAAGNHGHSGFVQKYVLSMVIAAVGQAIDGTNTSYARSWGFENGPSNAGFANADNNTSRAVMPTSGTITAFYVRTRSTQPTGGSFVFTLRKNDADTALVVTVPTSGAAGNYSATGSIGFVAGDFFTVKVVNNSANPSAQISSWSFEVSP